MKKWVVNVHDWDGVHTKTFKSANTAFNHASKLLGYTIEVEDPYDNFVDTDDLARKIEVICTNKGDCTVCGSVDTNTVTIVISHKRHNVPKNYKIDVCESCADDFVFGGWTIEYEDGEYKIKHL